MGKPAPHRFYRYVVAGGLLAGTLDLIYICTLWSFKGVGPVRILHSVASGWVGREAAVAGGAGTALLGLVSHFGIAIAMAGTYFLAARRWGALARNPWRYGALYGVLLYVVMNHVVVPLSAAGAAPAKGFGWMDASHLAAHMLLVGIPCALAARKALAARVRAI
ncbi:MAG TPA: hypothetical protein VIT22_09495 [Pseudoxanthomonas sp.]